jgi:FMN phosphatase YigB (HAD superfamily)
LLNPQFIYFDLDDTLLDHRKAEKCALRDVKGHFAEHFDSVRANHLENVYHEGNVDLWERYAHGTIKKEQLRIRRFEILLEALAIELLDPHEVSDYYLSRWDSFAPSAPIPYLYVASRSLRTLTLNPLPL